MTITDLDQLLPEIIPATDAEKIKWKGPLAHIGPLSAMTPLKQELMGKTCCALYVLFIGCIGLINRRMVPIMDIGPNRLLAEQIFAYQFDWRYAKPYGIGLLDIEDTPDKMEAIRETIAYNFFSSIERTNGYFLSTAPIDEIAFIVNLTRHLCGKENKATVEGWIENMLERLEDIAPCDEYDTPVLDEFDTRTEWEEAVRVIHGTPLALEIMDLSTDPEKLDNEGLARDRLASLATGRNPLLHSAQELKDLGMRGTPYKPAE